MPCATPEPGVWQWLCGHWGTGYRKSGAEKVQQQDASLEGHMETDVESDDWFSNDVNTNLHEQLTVIVTTN